MLGSAAECSSSVSGGVSGMGVLSAATEFGNGVAMD